MEVIEHSEDCPCIDATNILESFSRCGEEEVMLANGTITTTYSGFWVRHYGLESACFPLSYGSNECGAHDLNADPRCKNPQHGEDGNTAEDGSSIPPWCTLNWCYVDPQICKRSQQILFPSLLFPEIKQTPPLFYSYSTCNSSSSLTDFKSTSALKGQQVTTVIPAIWPLAHFKNVEDSTEIAPIDGPEYYNDAIPWKGWLVDYLQSVQRVSNNEFQFDFTFRSGGADVAVPDSKYTAAVYDVKNRMSCLAASLFWITTERLEMTSFSAPLSIDKVVLWIPDPNTKENNFVDNLTKVMSPFENSLWSCLVLSVVVVSILSVWFVTEKGEKSRWKLRLRSTEYQSASMIRRASICSRVLLESFLSTVFSFFTSSVEYDVTGGLPINILNFGYALLVLISIAAYTANLAAFLTLSVPDEYYSSLKQASADGINICAHPAVQSDLELAWPDANFIFETNNPDLYEGMLERYDNGDCEVLVAGVFDILHDEAILQGFCDRGLKNTESVVLEKLLAMPVCDEFSAGISYWISEAALQDITFEKFETERRPTPTCQLELNVQSVADELQPLSVANFALPFLVLILSSTIAIFLHSTRSRRAVMSNENSRIQQGPLDTSSIEGDKLGPYGSEINKLTLDTRRKGLPRPPSFSDPQKDVLTDHKALISKVKEIQEYQNSLLEHLVQSKKKN